MACADCLRARVWQALINPLPALGVCLEVRPAVLEAETPLERVEAVKDAITDSISRLKRLPPGPFEVEPPPKRTYGD